MNKTALLLYIGFMSIILMGCVGSPVHSTVTYNRIQSTIKQNNENLLLMKIGMTQEETRKLMGSPERSEGYAWGSAWLYRTAMTSGVYGTSDSDFTPIVFGPDGKVIGWGRNFFTEHIKRYEIKIKNE
ncbi:MAG: DUF3192 domain-containing protein [Nitrospirota bacterium]